MANIQSIGIGSGVLTNDLIDDLVAAEREPVEQRLTAKEERLNAEISEFGNLSSLLSQVQSAASGLNLSSSFRSNTASSSNESALTATASSLATAGVYSVEVGNLAQSQTLASGTYSGINDVVGEGDLVFTFGDVDYDSVAPSFSFTADPEQATQTVTIDSSNHTLAGIRDAVNNADIGVRAAIVDVGSGYRLTFTSEATGDNNGFTLGVNNPANGLDDLAFEDDTTTMLQTVAAADANLTVNGLAVSRESNLVTGVINGVTLNLKQQTGGPVSLSVSPDTEAVTERVQGFVDAYNELKTAVNEVTAFDTDTGQGSLLTGDSTVRTMTTRLQRLLASQVDALMGESISTLAGVGITTNGQTGLLQFDSSQFTDALSANPGKVTTLFAQSGSASDSLVEFVSGSSATQAGTYEVFLTQTASQGYYTGVATGQSSFTIDTDNDDLAVQVDGTTSGTITLTAGSYTGAELATELQAQINADSALSQAGRTVSVSFDSGTGAFTITSGRYGSSSLVNVVGVDTNTTADLGLALVNGTNGVDVAGTINGVAASGVGQRLVGANGTAVEGLRLNILGGTTGDRGTVTFSRGVADQIYRFANDFLGSNGGLSIKQDGLQTQLSDIAEERGELEERISALRARLEAQFAFNDSIIQQLNNTGDYLTQQLDLLAAGLKRSE